MTRPNFSFNLPGAWKQEKPNGSPETSGVTASAVTISETSTGVDRHKPRGWLTPQGYTLTFRNRRRAVGKSRDITNPNNLTNGHVWTGVVGGSQFDSDAHYNITATEAMVTDATLSDKALLKARLKMKRAEVNLGVAFAERNATARLLGDTATSLGKAFRNLKAGRVRAAMRDLGISNKRHEPRGSNVPNKWLELQYGWKPLLSDVFGACDALSKQPKSDWRVTAKATAKRNERWEHTFTDHSAGIVVAQSECGAFCRIDALPENDLTKSLSSLGITNPLLIAWELVPYSFVVDWALPVGSWLESIDAMLGYSRSQYSNSLLTRARWDERGIRINNTTIWGGYYDNNYEGYKRLVKLTRAVSNNVPMPTFPRIKDPLSLGHMANGLSLLASAFGRR